MEGLKGGAFIGRNETTAPGIGLREIPGLLRGGSQHGLLGLFDK